MKPDTGYLSLETLVAQSIHDYSNQRNFLWDIFSNLINTKKQELVKNFDRFNVLTFFVEISMDFNCSVAFFDGVKCYGYLPTVGFHHGSSIEIDVDKFHYTIPFEGVQDFLDNNYREVL